MKAIISSISIILATVSLATLTIAVEPDDPRRQSEFDLSLNTLHSEDYSDWSAGLSWHVLFKRSNLADFPLRQAGVSFATDGMLALDEEQNRTPLTAELDLFFDTLLGQERVRNDAVRDAAAGTGGFISTDAANGFSAFFLETGLSARYETDQALDNRNAAVSAFLQFTNPNSGNLWTLVPSVRVSFDGVFGAEATAGTGGNDADPGEYTRLRADAFWLVQLSALADGAFFERSALAFAGEYTKSFDTSAAHEAADLDESLGAWVEYQWLLDDGVRLSGDYEAPLIFYVRGTFGRFAPVPEEDTSVIIGLRLGLKDRWHRALH